MAIKPDRVKAGDVLYEKRRTKMGNTTLSRDSVYEVRILAVEEVQTPFGTARKFTVSWNGNTPQLWLERAVSRLYRSRPKTKPSPFERF